MSEAKVCPTCSSNKRKRDTGISYCCADPWHDGETALPRFKHHMLSCPADRNEPIGSSMCICLKVEEGAALPEPAQAGQSKCNHDKSMQPFGVSGNMALSGQCMLCDGQEVEVGESAPHSTLQGGKDGTQPNRGVDSTMDNNCFTKSTDDAGTTSHYFEQDGERHSEGSELDHSSAKAENLSVQNSLKAQPVRSSLGERSLVHPEGPSRRDEASPAKISRELKASRTAWLEQHGVPISIEFARFADAIGVATNYLDRASLSEGAAVVPPVPQHICQTFQFHPESGRIVCGICGTQANSLTIPSAPPPIVTAVPPVPQLSAREEFEKLVPINYWRDHPGVFQLGHMGDYLFHDVQNAWEVWQAYADEKDKVVAQLRQELDAWENYKPCMGELENWAFQHFDFLDDSEKTALKIMSNRAKKADELESEVARLKEEIKRLESTPKVP